MKKRVLSIMTALIMAVSFIGVMPAVTAGAANVPKITYKTINKSYYADDGHKIYEIKLKRPIIHGNKKSYKKINKYFKKLQNSYIKNLSDYIYIAKEDYKLRQENFDIEFIKSSINLVLQKGNTISFKETYKYYGGGPHGECHINGYTYNIKTGKKVNISQVTKYGSKIKSKIVAKFQKKVDANPNLYFNDSVTNSMEEVKNTKLKDFNYYLKDEYVYVIYNVYEIAPYSSGLQKVRIKIK